MTPFADAPFYSEKIVQLPDSYQVNEWCRSSHLRRPLAGKFRAERFDFGENFRFNRHRPRVARQAHDDTDVAGDHGHANRFGIRWLDRKAQKLGGRAVSDGANKVVGKHGK